jgi:hypothetical protein
MKYTNKIALISFSCMIVTLSLNAQVYSIYNDKSYDPFMRSLNVPGINFHTSVQPYRLDQIEKIMPTDSLIQRGLYKPDSPMNIFRRFIHDDFVSWEEKGNAPVFVRVNPLFNLEVGKDMSDGLGTWINTRGVMVEGKLGKDFAFYADLYENQGVYPDYVQDFVSNRGVVPGQGRAKIFKDTGFDFAQSTGYISYNAGQWINLQLGHGKNFIGDGHRSLLLSDNTYSYPFIKMTTTFMKVKYLVMVGQFMDLGDEVIRGGDDRFEYKYGVFHYLNWNIGNRLSLGLFESVIWAAKDDTGHRGMDFNYLNPIVVYRPVEYSLGSPDNVTMGINLKYLLWKDAAFYGQYVMGEFKQDEVFSGSKWWANKQGFQAGLKSYNFLGINNLDVQTEYNQVRPYTYSHYWPITNYGHFNQELAHPLGASFRESVSFLRYRYKRFHLDMQAMYAIHGRDLDDEISYGGDIFRPNLERPSNPYGHEIGQGLRTTIAHGAATISYLINPKNNMNISLSTRIRKLENDLESQNSNLVSFSFRTSLRNIYYDF